MDNRVSVIVPVYNAENTVEKCVESILYGELRDVDVILVDDCSADNSWRVCQSLAGKFANVSCYRNDRNGGVSYTRNHGLKEAKGKYVLFVDSDDWVSGRYAAELFRTAERYSDSLVICGSHFLNEVDGYRCDYLWEKGGQPVYFISRDQFFDLPGRFHLQQLWNKIFRRDIIEQKQIRFDETQSMGEDFQFVLDYMERAPIKQCVVLNEALYYYLRSTDTSLMSKFGTKKNGNEDERFRQLLKICGEDNLAARQRCEQAILSTKKNFVYQCARDKTKSKREKIAFIESVMKDGQAASYYRKQKVLMIKETLAEMPGLASAFYMRMKGRIQRDKQESMIKEISKKLIAEGFSVISQNCIGGVLYHDLGMQFLSPTINLFFREPDFVRFVLGLERYMNADLEMSWGEEYPIGILGGDVRIDFMHYHSCEEARKNWNERKKRLNWEKIVVLATDRNGFTDEVFTEWKKIPYPKVLFTVNKAFAEEPGTILFPEYEAEGFVPDLIPKREFYKNDILLSVINNISGQEV